jgi:hypothetical protein
MILAMMGISLSAFLALTVVAVDIGRLAFTATEVQTVADVAATAGATAAVNGGNADAEARRIALENSVDGAAASTAVDNLEIEIGNYLLAAVLGSPTTTVEKTATASFTTVSGATPELPMAIGSCYFENLCDGCLPNLIQVPSNTGGDANNTGWTGFFGTASNSNMSGYIPAPCGGGVTPPHVEVGDVVSLNNGQIPTLINAIQCLLDQGINEFVVPVVQSSSSSCGGPINQGAPVTGFVTLVVDSVKATGNPKYVNLHAVFNANVIGTPGGCEDCGSGQIVLVN